MRKGKQRNIGRRERNENERNEKYGKKETGECEAIAIHHNKNKYRGKK